MNNWKYLDSALRIVYRTHSDGACESTDVANLPEGAAIDPYVAPPTPIPVVVEMAQARLALLGAGHLATVNAAIAGMTGIEGDGARIEWEFRPTVRRDSALTQAMAAILSLSEEDLDTLFTAAAAL